MEISKSNRFIRRPFIYSGDRINPTIVKKYIDKHIDRLSRFEELENLYIGNHNILSKESKAQGKPDNRLVVNYAKYIVDTFTGFFIGIPVRVVSDNENINEFIQFHKNYNNTEDLEAEIAKMVSIYGSAFELLYQDTNSKTRSTWLTPKEAFVVYDNTIEQDPVFAVYMVRDEENLIKGSIYTINEEITFRTAKTGDIEFLDTKNHYFGEVPVIEYFENDERLGTFESVETLINAYNKAISEKANDVDYFSDAYLKILGVEIDDETLGKLRDSRIINISQRLGDSNNIDVSFLEKPNADQTQENLIDRLEDLIYDMSQIANITDDHFAQRSGISLEYKLLPMKNLALMKERKFKAALSKRYRLLFRIITNIKGISDDEWTKLRYIFSRNIPENLKDEAETASTLTGLLSKETVLSTLSIVDDPKKEIERMESEKFVGQDDFDFNLDRFDLDEKEE